MAVFSGFRHRKIRSLCSAISGPAGEIEGFVVSFTLENYSNDFGRVMSTSEGYSMFGCQITPISQGTSALRSQILVVDEY